MQGELTTDGLAAQWIGIPFAAPPVSALIATVATAAGTYPSLSNADIGDLGSCV